MVQLRQFEQVDHRASRAGFGVSRAEHHALEPGMQHGAAAHGAGFQRDKQLAFIEPVVSKGERCGAQCDDLGMRRRVMPINRCVPAGGNDLALPHDDRADRDLPLRSRFMSLREGQPHKPLIIHDHYIFYSRR